jgi:hypothetical protein
MYGWQGIVSIVRNTMNCNGGVYVCLSGAYTTHNLVCRMALTSYDQIPAELARWAFVEFTMPATQVGPLVLSAPSEGLL